MTESERWSVLRDALRVRLSQAQAKEDRVSDDASKMAVRYAQMTLKDIIRIMNKLEQLCRCLTRSALGCRSRLCWN